MKLWERRQIESLIQDVALDTSCSIERPLQKWLHHVRTIRPPRATTECNHKAYEIPTHRQSNEDGAVIRNIDACQALANTVKTSFGPYGRNKIVINHLQKMILTNDAATILRELDVVHPAVKIVVMATQQQESEVSIF